MQAIRAVIRGQTASFRVPYFIALQPSLPVPPPSTVRGIIHAIAGRWVDDLEWYAYRFEYEAVFTDLEKLHKYRVGEGVRTRQLGEAVRQGTYSLAAERSRARYDGTTIVRREGLYGACLYLYLPPEWEGALRRPRAMLSLGRSQDLAAIEEVRAVELEWRVGAVAAGILLESAQGAQAGLVGVTHALPVAFTRTQPRQPTAVKSYVLVDCHQPQQARTALLCEGELALAYIVSEESSTFGLARASTR